MILEVYTIRQSQCLILPESGAIRKFSQQEHQNAGCNYSIVFLQSKQMLKNIKRVIEKSYTESIYEKLCSVLDQYWANTALKTYTNSYVVAVTEQAFIISSIKYKQNLKRKYLSIKTKLLKTCVLRRRVWKCRKIS